MDVRIEGLYDKRTIDFLIENKVKHFGFNFSPKNFNFLQQKEFLKILDSFGRLEKYNFYLNVSGDHSSVINHLIQRTQKTLEQRGVLSKDLSLYLELNDIELSKARELSLSHVQGVFWHYCVQEHSLEEVLDIPKIQGVFLNYSDIKQMHENETLFNFMNNFMALFYSKNKDLKLGLLAHWNDDFFPSLFDFFDFDLISFGISNEVEVCYRNVDLAKMGLSLGHIRQLSLS